MNNFDLYVRPFLISFVLSLVFIKALILLSRRYGLFDSVGDRKIHVGEISRLGGVGIIAAFWLAVFMSGSLVFDGIKIGMIVCSVLIAIFGSWDDLKSLSWKKQLVFQMLIAFLMIYAGLNVDYIANPFGGREFRLDIFSLMGFSALGSLFIILWIVGFMNIINWLDGLDGLAGGVGAISAITLFVLSISDLVNQPPLAVMAIALVGSLFGFLAFNFHPAKIFMGSSGSLFLGFLLSVLAIFSGGKIATAFLVMGFPVLDAFWVIIMRLQQGKSPFMGDHNHLHYNLLDRGWPQRKVVIFIYFLSLIFGLSALVFKGAEKIIVIGILFLSFLFLIPRVKKKVF